MKALVAAACICIIGVTGWLALDAYADYKAAQRYAIYSKCSPIWNGEPYDVAGRSKSELRLRKSLIDECIEYLKTGY